jgi:hypothetical protein
VSSNQTIAQLDFTIRNNSSVFAEHIDVGVAMRDNLQPIMAPGWEKVEPMGIAQEITHTGENNITNAVAEWAYSPPDLQPNFGKDLPEIGVEILNFDPRIPPLIHLTALGKGFQISRVCFGVIFISTDVPRNPVIIHMTTNSMGRIFDYPSYSQRGQFAARENRAPNVQPVVVAAQPDFIEGTGDTYRQVEDFLPYGYVIIYLNEEGEKRTHTFRNKLLNWDFDWNQVKIEPNFSSGIATIDLTPKNWT